MQKGARKASSPLCQRQTRADGKLGCTGGEGNGGRSGAGRAAGAAVWECPGSVSNGLGELADVNKSHAERGIRVFNTHAGKIICVSCTAQHTSCPTCARGSSVGKDFADLFLPCVLLSFLHLKRGCVVSLCSDRDTYSTWQFPFENARAVRAILRTSQANQNRWRGTETRSSGWRRSGPSGAGMKSHRLLDERHKDIERAFVLGVVLDHHDTAGHSLWLSFGPEQTKATRPKSPALRVLRVPGCCRSPSAPHLTHLALRLLLLLAAAGKLTRVFRRGSSAETPVRIPIHGRTPLSHAPPPPLCRPFLFRIGAGSNVIPKPG